MANFRLERKNYSKFTAQIAKNMVKKKILEIRSYGARAADELIDELAEKAQKGSKNSQIPSLGDKIVPIIKKNRGKWRNFIIELAGRFDADSLAVFGVNLIYGGLLTSSAGNSGWAAAVSVESSDQRKLADIISVGRNRGSLVWILRGREAFSPETLKTCRYFPECAFILAANGDFDAAALSSVKNALVLLKNGDQKGEKELQRQGIPYIFANGSDPIFDAKGKGREGTTFSSLPPAVFGFLESPSFPISTNDLYTALDSVENLLSGGKSSHIPHYFA